MKEHDGVLWVLGNFEPAGLTPLLPPLRPGTTPESSDMRWRGEYLASIESITLWNERRIDVLYAFDAASGALLSTRVLDDLYMTQFLGGSSVVALAEDDLGRITATLYRLVLER